MLEPAHSISEGRILVRSRRAAVGLVVLACFPFLDGLDAVLTQGHSVSWWWQWTGSVGQRVLQARGRGGGLGISPGMPTLLLGFFELFLAIAVWSVVALRWHDRRILKWLAGLAAIIGLGAALAAGVLSFAM